MISVLPRNHGKPSLPRAPGRFRSTTPRIEAAWGNESTRSVDEAEGSGVLYGFAALLGAEFAVDALEVGLDRVG